MTESYIKTEDIEVFPSSVRNSSRSNYTTEENLVNITKNITDEPSYIIKCGENTDESYFCNLIIEGYYFEIKKLIIPEGTGDYIYASIEINNGSFPNLSPFEGEDLDSNGTFKGLKLTRSSTKDPKSNNKLFIGKIVNNKLEFDEVSKIKFKFKSIVNDDNTETLSDEIKKLENSIEGIKNTTINGSKISGDSSTITTNKWGKTISFTLNGIPKGNKSNTSTTSVDINGSGDVELSIPDTLGTINNEVTLNGRASRSYYLVSPAHKEDGYTVGGITQNKENIVSTSIKFDEGIPKESSKIYMYPLKNNVFPNPPTTASVGDLFIVYEE